MPSFRKKRSYKKKRQITRRTQKARRRTGRRGRNETKSLSYGNEDTAPFALLATPYLKCVNAVTQGTAPSQRIGRKISLKSITINGKFVPNNVAAACLATGVRMMLVYDKQPNVLQPTVANIIAECDAAGAVTSQFTSRANRDNEQRFSIIKDKIYQLPNLAIAGDYSNTLRYIYNWRVNLKGRQTTYFQSAAPPTYADITTGSLHLIMFSDVATSNWEGNHTTRLTFNDT